MLHKTMEPLYKPQLPNNPFQSPLKLTNNLSNYTPVESMMMPDAELH